MAVSVACSYKFQLHPQTSFHVRSLFVLFHATNDSSLICARWQERETLRNFLVVFWNFRYMSHTGPTSLVNLVNCAAVIASGNIDVVTWEVE